MSLNWSISEIKDFETMCYDDAGKDEDGETLHKLSSITNGLIWATMGIGIGEITKANWQEFYARLRVLDKLTGHTSLQERNDETGKFEPRPFTAEEVKAHIGLTTNVFPKESVAKWSTRVVANRLDDITRGLA